MPSMKASRLLTVLTAACALAACAPSLEPPLPERLVADVPQSRLFQPLAVGDSWTYTCRDIKGGAENGGNPFSFTDRVLRDVKHGPQEFAEFALHVPIVPSKPLKIVTELMLLTNDAHGNLWIHGYVVHGKIAIRKRTEIVAAVNPAKYARFDYLGPTGKRVQRFFYGYVPTNPTPLGTFLVADYEESHATNDYGYAYGKGIMEEDHGPNFEVDCLIRNVVLK
jgi:hypothetical protein